VTGISTDDLPVGVARSVTVALMLKVPFAEYVTVKLVTFPAEAGLPPGADQLNVYGGVPPVADALQATGLPTVPVFEPPAQLAEIWSPAPMMTVIILLACTLLPSVAVTLMFLFPVVL